MELFGLRKFHRWTRVRAFFLSYSAHWGMKGIEYSHLLAVPLPTMLIETPVIRLSLFFLSLKRELIPGPEVATTENSDTYQLTLPITSTPFSNQLSSNEIDSLRPVCIDADTLPAFKVALHAVPWTAAQNAPHPHPRRSDTPRRTFYYDSRFQTKWL